MKKKSVKKTESVIGRRKVCSASGTGLSHYILIQGK